MKNSASNESFNYIESEDEDEEKWNRDEDDSDSSHSSMVMRQGSTPNAYSNAWPQSYR